MQKIPIELQHMNECLQQLLQQNDVSGSDIDSFMNELPIGFAIDLENKMAIGTGNFVVKVWVESDRTGCRTPDFQEKFQSLKEAHEHCEFLKDMKDVDACYIIRLKPYKLMERVIRFPSDR